MDQGLRRTVVGEGVQGMTNNIEIPEIKNKGYFAMINARVFRSYAAPEGFVFCPFKIGTNERLNFLAGVIEASRKAAGLDPRLAKQ